MTKELLELTQEELWTLFPIILKAHNPDYKSWYSDKRQELLARLPQSTIKRINHIGSTVVRGLIAKPTVDILLEIDDQADIEDMHKRLLNSGWTLMHDQGKDTINYVYVQGYSKNGFEDKVYHLHIRNHADWNELYFRDYLMDHPQVAEAYGQLKENLITVYRNNRDGYTEAKTDFIKGYTEKARVLYKDRYKEEK